MINVKGKWALITGASRGLGYQVARFMAEKGCNLLVQSRSKSHLVSTIALSEEYGVEVIGLEAELSDEVSVERLLENIDGLNHQIDFVFNNAGLQATYQVDYLKTPMPDFVTSLQVNVIAPMMICYHFLPKMKERGFGRIINTTSGIDKEPQQAPYSASKAALDKVTKDLASTVEGSNVVISLVDPGWCRTDMGGSQAPNSPASALPGLVLGAFAGKHVNGKVISAQVYSEMTLVEALEQV